MKDDNRATPRNLPRVDPNPRFFWTETAKQARDLAYALSELDSFWETIARFYNSHDMPGTELAYELQVLGESIKELRGPGDNEERKEVS